MIRWFTDLIAIARWAFARWIDERNGRTQPDPQPPTASPRDHAHSPRGAFAPLTGKESTDMLVLARAVNQDVVIGPPERPIGIVRVVKIQGDKVRIGFDFPRSVPINRAEVAERIADALLSQGPIGDGMDAAFDLALDRHLVGECETDEQLVELIERAKPEHRERLRTIATEEGKLPPPPPLQITQ